MDLKGLGQIQIMNEFTSQSQSSLCLLYYPLIGKDAFILYEILSSFSNQSVDQEKLIFLTQLNEVTFEKARTVLEEFGLLKTYFDANQRIWLYALYAPLNPEEFLSHETFGRLLINETSSLHFDFMKMHFNTGKEIPSSFMNISKPLDINRLNKWSDDKEFVFNQLKPKNVLEEQLNFDFAAFYKGMDRIFPPRLRTEKNLRLIARLANIHGLDAKEMKKYVQRSINPKTGEFDEEKLKKQVMYNQPKGKRTQDPYQMSPVQFMVSKQNGAPISNADKSLIQSLCLNYPFSNEVVNVLIEYVLTKTNQQFNRAYVEKVAASWARKKIDTKEKALMEFKSGKKQAENTSLPDWYADTGSSKMDEDTLQQALELQRKLKGDTQ